MQSERSHKVGDLRDVAGHKRVVRGGFVRGRRLSHVFSGSFRKQRNQLVVLAEQRAYQCVDVADQRIEIAVASVGLGGHQGRVVKAAMEGIQHLLLSSRIVGLISGHLRRLMFDLSHRPVRACPLERIVSPVFPKHIVEQLI